MALQNRPVLGLTGAVADAFQSDTEKVDYLARHELGEVPNELSAFPTFYETRRERLLEKISRLLKRQPEPTNLQ